MRVSTAAIVLCASGLTTSAWAQGGHVAGGLGMAAGTGGPAPAVAVSAAVEPSPHLGLALELSVTPRLDFGAHVIGPVPTGGIPVPTLPTLPTLPALPAMTITSTGTLTTVQVNIIVPLTTAGKLRVSAIAGGGTASVRSRVHLHRDAVTFPGITGLPLPGTVDLPGLILPAQDITTTGSVTGLALNTGAVVDYALTAKTGVGVDLRYLHTSASGIDMFRAMGRVIWRF
jgi:hypothetical protein